MAHYTEPPQENQPIKSREEQDADFAFLAEYADKNCPTCFGTAKNGFNTETQLYVPCGCLLSNLNKEVEKERQNNAEQGGILQRFNQMFGRN